MRSLTLLWSREQFVEEILRHDANVPFHMLIQHQSSEDGRFILSTSSLALPPVHNRCTLYNSRHSFNFVDQMYAKEEGMVVDAFKLKSHLRMDTCTRQTATS